MLKVVVHHRANKKVRLLAPKEKIKIATVIENLSKDPFGKSLNTVKLEGTKCSYRVRIGNLRVIYELHTDQGLLVVREIDYRGSVY